MRDLKEGSARLEPLISWENLNILEASQRTVTQQVKGPKPSSYLTHRTLSNTDYFTTSTSQFYKMEKCSAIDLIVTGIKARSRTITANLYTGVGKNKDKFTTLLIPASIYQSTKPLRKRVFPISQH